MCLCFAELFFCISKINHMSDSNLQLCNFKTNQITTLIQAHIINYVLKSFRPKLSLLLICEAFFNLYQELFLRTIILLLFPAWLISSVNITPGIISPVDIILQPYRQGITNAKI